MTFCTFVGGAIKQCWSNEGTRNVLVMLVLYVESCVHLSLLRYGKLEVARYLIEHATCQPDCKDNSGQTPLHHACQ